MHWRLWAANGRWLDEVDCNDFLMPAMISARGLGSVFVCSTPFPCFYFFALPALVSCDSCRIARRRRGTRAPDRHHLPAPQLVSAPGGPRMREAAYRSVPAQDSCRVPARRVHLCNAARFWCLRPCCSALACPPAQRRLPASLSSPRRPSKPRRQRRNLRGRSQRQPARETQAAAADGSGAAAAHVRAVRAPGLISRRPHAVSGAQDRPAGTSGAPAAAPAPRGRANFTTCRNSIARADVA